MTTEQVYSDFRSQLSGFIRSRVTDADAASDILQEVFMKIHQHLPGLQDRQKVTSWVYQITRNAIADHYRKLKPQGELTHEPADLPTALPPQDFARCMLKMVAHLPPDYADALRQTELGTLSQKAYAEQLGISYSGAKSRVQRAKQQLKQLVVDCCAVQTDKYGNVLSAKENCAC